MANTAVTQNPRNRLLQTASRLFYAHGIGRVGINEVIRAAGIARMTLYNHFPSKDELVREVLRMRIREWEESFVQAIESRAKGSRKQLLAVFDVLDDHFSKAEFRGCAALNFAFECSEQDRELTAIARGHKAFILAYLEKLARRLPSSRPGDLARELLLLHNGATVLAQLGGETYHLGDAKRAAAQLIAGYENPEPRQRGAVHE